MKILLVSLFALYLFGCTVEPVGTRVYYPAGYYGGVYYSHGYYRHPIIVERHEFRHDHYGRHR